MKKVKKEKLPIELPEPIDTPQAEQLVVDVYKIYEFLKEHKKKIVTVALAIALVSGTVGFILYKKKVAEETASRFLDEAIVLIENGKKEEGIKLLKESAKYNSPSGKMARIYLADLTKNENLLKGLVDGSSVISSSAKLILVKILLEKGKTEEAKKILLSFKRDEFGYPQSLYLRAFLAYTENNTAELNKVIDELRANAGMLPVRQLLFQMLGEEGWRLGQ